MQHDSQTVVTATPERINTLASALLGAIRGSMKEIGDINLQTRLLSMNAQIEAGRAGEAGRSFAVVGREMVALSGRTQEAAQRIERESESLVLELAEISRLLATRVRGTRLSDLALTNIDLIDRNLYERSCDCRWWATDTAMVDAVAKPGAATATQASERLGVILKAYTVYFDIVLADSSGRIVANGRPAEFASVGTSHATAPWFTSAMTTKSGDEFGFQSVHASPLVNRRRVLVYSCKVCAGGDARGRPLGVLGVVFNWDGLAQKIAHETPIEAAARSRTRVCIVDDDGLILADSQDRLLTESLPVAQLKAVFSEKKTSAVVPVAGVPMLVAHALSPGFETYRTGWHSLVLERLAG